MPGANATPRTAVVRSLVTLPLALTLVAGCSGAPSASPHPGPPASGMASSATASRPGLWTPTLVSLTPAATPTPAATVVAASKLSFKQDALVDPVVTGRLVGDGGAAVEAQIFEDGSWTTRANAIADADGSYSVPLSYNTGLPGTERWRIVSGRAASPDITVVRTAVLNPTSRPVTKADVSASWRDGCPVDYTELRLLQVNHFGFDGRLRRGSVVVRATVLANFEGLFQTMLDNRFPIRQMQLVEAYGGNDEASAAADNTSVFNCRLTTGGSRWSDHAFGVAIDVNPVENPYTDRQILPPAGVAYLDRTNVRTGMLTAGSPVIAYAMANGWLWLSGYDYQHLEVIGAR